MTNTCEKCGQAAEMSEWERMRVALERAWDNMAGGSTAAWERETDAAMTTIGAVLIVVYIACMLYWTARSFR